jgi:abortive infection bacteriophage resistance protein
MFDKVTTLTIAYNEFFEVFSNTKRILVEDKINYDKYLTEIRLYALKGYSSSDITEILKSEYLN